MKSTYGTAAISLLLLQVMRLDAAGVDEVYHRGILAYENEQWELAIQEFESIFKSGYESEVLYYNLGNAYYRDGNIAGSVWAFEKALQLDPNDGDSRFNLTLANLKVEDRIQLPEIPFYIRMYRGLRESYTPREWLFGISLILLLAAAAYAMVHISQWTWLSWLVPAGTLVAFLLLIVAVDQIWTEKRTRDGIIYAETVAAYSAPSERSIKLFEVHAGLKVSLLKESSGWYQIELLDGKNGWIPLDQLRAL